ncbi:MAG: polyribonucleotide nucleotidyltransferase [Deltaproteobacteria bacterium]
MTLKKQLVAFVCLIVTIALIIQLAGCGAIIYPERRGQTGGRIDVGIAILDAAWLIVFIIPGLIAFGVDFTTGAIYMPSGRRRSVSADVENMTVVRINPGELNEKTIEDIVKRYTGCSTSLCLSNAEVYVLDSPDKIAPKLAELRKSGYRTH